MLNPALTKSRSKVSNSAFAREARASISVNDRASLETTMASFPSSFCADSRPAFERLVTRTRAPPSSSVFAVASPMPLVPPIITTFLPWYLSIYILLPSLGCFADFELFGMIIRRGGCGQELFELVIQNTVGPRGRSCSAAIACCSGYRDHFAATGAPSGHRAQGCWEEKSTPETLTTACHAASWLARSWRCGWRCASIGPVNFP